MMVRHHTIFTMLLCSASAVLVAGDLGVPSADADATAYLVNVTVRPGYHFANADDALSYGYGICEKIRGGRGYADLVTDTMSDFATSDAYQGSYLIAQAVNELCPALIWQLRNSAAGYRLPGP